MTRTENDLRDALRDLDQRAVAQGAPSTASILTHATDARLKPTPDPAPRRVPRWLPPLAAAAVVAAAAVTAVTLSSGQSDPSGPQAGTQPTSAPTPARHTAAASHHSSAEPSPSLAATVLEDAAATLDTAPPWTTPSPRDFYYVHTTDATTWTSVSGKQPGDGRTTGGDRIAVPGCRHGRIVANGESGSCTLNDVPHYRGNAPSAPAAWDDYLEQIAPGAKAANAQGKIIVQVLHGDLLAPEATAALLRYTQACPGLHTVAVRPVTGEALIGVTCTSMTNGSYALAFDAASHAFVGYVVVTQSGHQDGPAEIVRKTGIVPALGRTP